MPAVHVFRCPMFRYISFSTATTGRRVFALTKRTAFIWTGYANTPTRLAVVHGYVLMINRVHLLISAERAEAPGALTKALGQRYVQYAPHVSP